MITHLGNCFDPTNFPHVSFSFPRIVVRAASHRFGIELTGRTWSVFRLN
jgi:hypothetical protein